MADAYLDIETTGLSRYGSEITVIGLYVVNGIAANVTQLVGGKVTPEGLLKALASTENIYTYNGRRFDLPFIKEALGVNLKDMFNHHDLMYDCWKCNLYGGLKSVEQQLQIPRQLKGIDGYDAVRLWYQYKNYGDYQALNKLLHYNREDVINLKRMRDRLKV